MPETERNVPLPLGANWVQITDELLASSLADEFEDLVDRFMPTPHLAGHEMVDWLRAGVADRKMPNDTYLLRTRNELLGFVAVDCVELEFSHRARPILELRRPELRERARRLARDPQPGLMLSAIVRAHSTPRGFGRVLLEHAIGVALTEPTTVAVLVQPANDVVARLWRDTYRFRPMDDPKLPGLLYFPVDKPPEATWP